MNYFELGSLRLSLYRADPGFQVRGGALNKIAPSGGWREHFWGISWKNHDFMPKNHIFFPIIGGGEEGAVAPPGSAPALA